LFSVTPAYAYTAKSTLWATEPACFKKKGFGPVL